MGGFVLPRAVRNDQVWNTQRNRAFQDYGLASFQARPVFLSPGANATAFWNTAGPVNMFATEEGWIHEVSITAGTVNPPVWDDVNGKGLNIIPPGSVGTPMTFEYMLFTAMNTVGSSRSRSVPSQQSGAILSPGMFFRCRFRVENAAAATGSSLLVGLRTAELPYLSTDNYASVARMTLNPAGTLFTAKNGAVTSSGNLLAVIDNQIVDFRIDLMPKGEFVMAATATHITTGVVTTFVPSFSGASPSPPTLGAGFYVPNVFCAPSSATALATIWLQEAEFGPRVPGRR